MIINGKEYPLWSQFVERKGEFIGGFLQEFQNPDEEGNLIETVIIDITLNPNGDDSAFFSIIGSDFTCGSDCKYIGIKHGEIGWLTFEGYGGHTFRIKEHP